MNDSNSLLDAQPETDPETLPRPSLSRTTQPLRSTVLPSPAKAQRDLPQTASGAENVATARQNIEAILSGDDSDRLLVICGPCSINDLNPALVYAQKLSKLSDRVGDKLQLVMRTYFEKPRSVVGWKGLLYDTLQEGERSASGGIAIARRLLTRINDNGVACATEFLSPMLALFIEDTIAYGSIGSRTAESQIHRELASQLPLPIGMKNAMDGNPSSAINAVQAASQPHAVFSHNELGQPCLVETVGNPSAHVILRGGSTGPNFDAETVNATINALSESPLRRPVVVDCSHGNSCKDHRQQAKVAREVVRQFREGQRGIAGIMLESYLVEGRQNAESGSPIRFGQSITDACIGWDETESLLLEIADSL